ncbi:MAG: hypothetical protein AAGD28_07025, partial [Bacteroidota bacterium]
MNRKINKNFLIIGAMVLATVLAFLLISIFSKNNPAVNPGVVTEAALKEEILQLESNLLELELVFSEKDDQVENFETLLDEKYVELDNMSQKVSTLEEQIERLEREGKTDKRTIRELRQRVAEARGKLVETYKAEIDLLVFDLGTLTRTQDSLKDEALKKQTAFDSLKNVYDDCQASGGGMAMTSPSPAIETPTPAAVTERPPGFYANNFKITGYNKSNGSLNRNPTFIKKGKLDHLKYEFNFEGFGDVPKGVKILYLVFEHERSKKVLYGNQDASGVRFNFNGASLRSTYQVNANFTGGSQPVIVEFKDA